MTPLNKGAAQTGRLISGVASLFRDVIENRTPGCASCVANENSVQGFSVWTWIRGSLDTLRHSYCLVSCAKSLSSSFIDTPDTLYSHPLHLRHRYADTWPTTTWESTIAWSPPKRSLSPGAVASSASSTHRFSLHTTESSIARSRQQCRRADARCSCCPQTEKTPAPPRKNRSLG